MKTVGFLLAAALALASSTLPTSVSAETENDPWTYKANQPDHFNPSQWFRQYPDCAGARQSPIDIVPRPKTNAQATLPIHFSGLCPSFNIKQYWESFKAETASGSCALAVNGKSYNFAQIHFHAPSEHTINGEAHDGETHFVHKAADGTIAVVGLFIQKAHQAQASSDPFLRNFLHQLKNVNQTHSVSASLGSYIPALQTAIHKGKVFNYPGSLTTPACSQVVDWWVIETPLLVSEAEFSEIHKELKRIGAADAGKNARPTQPVNGRTVTAY